MRRLKNGVSAVVAASFVLFFAGLSFVYGANQMIGGISGMGEEADIAGVTVSLVGKPSIHTTSILNGDGDSEFYLTLPTNSVFSLKFEKAGHITSYSTPTILNSDIGDFGPDRNTDRLSVVLPSTADWANIVSLSGITMQSGKGHLFVTPRNNTTDPGKKLVGIMTAIVKNLSGTALVNTGNTRYFNLVGDSFTLSATATSNTIGFVVFNLAPGTVITSAAMSGKTFNSRQTIIYPGSLTSCNSRYDGIIESTPANFTGSFEDENGTIVPSVTTNLIGVQTAPKVTLTVPVNGATDVLLNSKITATFNEPMDQATIIANATFRVNETVGGDTVYGTVICNSNGTVATFTPNSALAYNRSYTATITTGATDMADNALVVPAVGGLPVPNPWTFTTGMAPDTTAPMMILTDPVDGDIGVAINSSVTATFNEKMDQATIIANATFRVNETVSGNAVYGTATFNPAGTTAIFTPNSALADSTRYTATITSGATDLAGNALVVPAMGGPVPNPWTFTTGTVSDTSTMSDGSGNFTLSNIPYNNIPKATTSTYLKATKTGYKDTYGLRIFDAGTDLTQLTFLSTSAVNQFASQAGVTLDVSKGCIVGNVKDNSAGEKVSGAVGKIFNPDGTENGAWVYYLNSSGNIDPSLTSTSSFGSFIAFNIDPSTPLILTAQKGTQEFPYMLDRTFANGLTMMEIKSSSTLPAHPASISGTISYSGTKTGTVGIGLFTTSDFSGVPAYGTQIASPGSYSIPNIAPGTYYIGASMDTNGNNIYDSTLDPAGVYASNPKILSNNQNATGINIILTDPAAFNPYDPNGSGTTTMADVLICYKQYLGLPTAYPLADVDGGGVTMRDVLKIYKRYLGL